MFTILLNFAHFSTKLISFLMCSTSVLSSKSFILWKKLFIHNTFIVIFFQIIWIPIITYYKKNHRKMDYFKVTFGFSSYVIELQYNSIKNRCKHQPLLLALNSRVWNLIIQLYCLLLFFSINCPNFSCDNEMKASAISKKFAKIRFGFLSPLSIPRLSKRAK